MPKTVPLPTRAEILQQASEGTLLDALFDIYGRHWFEPDDPTILLLADMHNEGEIDLLGLVSADALQPYQGQSFFRGQNTYCALITKLDTNAKVLLEVVELLRNAAGNDGASGLPIVEFGKWCSKDPDRPRQLLSLIDSGVENAQNYLSISLKCGVAVDAPYFMARAYSFLQTGTETQRMGAIQALWQIAFSTDADWDELIAAFSAALTPDPGDRIRSSLLQAVSGKLEGAPPDRIGELEQIAVRSILPLGEHTLFQCAQALAFNFAVLTPKLVDTLLVSLTNVNPEHRGTIDLVDHGLANLVQAGRPEDARTFIEAVVGRTGGPLKLKQFDSLIHKLREVGGLVLEDWVVAWLRLGKFRLCNQMDKAMFGAASNEAVFAIDFSRYGLRESEYAFLARKAIATFFLKPVIMASLLASLLRSAPPEVSKDIEALLLDPVLMNYSGVASRFLQPLADDPTDAAAPAAGRALQRLQTYLTGLRSIGIVRELHPSERERRLEWERHSDAMTEAMRAARKKSIFAQIATESLMLYGDRSVSWVSFADETPKRMETELASFGTSFEMPRIDIVDPIGLQLMLLNFRAESPPE